jgi:hypothetical protein
MSLQLKSPIKNILKFNSKFYSQIAIATCPFFQNKSLSHL